MKEKINNLGFYVLLYGLVLVLGWIGLFKFTPTEAQAIVPLVQNSPVMRWMYQIFTVQWVSNIIGSIEILAAVLMALYPFAKNWALWGACISVFIFVGTLSFIFTTPDAISIVDGFWLPDAFIMKDGVLLGASLIIMGRSLSSKV